MVGTPILYSNVGSGCRGRGADHKCVATRGRYFAQSSFHNGTASHRLARCIDVIRTVGGRQQSISGDHRAHGRMDEWLVETEGGGHSLRQTLGNATLIFHPGLLLDRQCVLRTVQYALKRCVQ